MNDLRLNEIIAAREAGLTWSQVAHTHGYVNGESAAGSFHRMLRKRGLRAIEHEQRTVTVELVARRR